MDRVSYFSGLNKEEIDEFYSELNQELKCLGLTETLYVHGGAVMCDLGSRNSTMDIDAFYKNTDAINNITKKIAIKHGRDFDFMNDDIKPFLSNKGTYRQKLSLSNLIVMYAEDEYLFALKCSSCRTESNDVKDLIFLTKKLEIKTQEQAAKIISKYFDLREVSILYKDVLEDIWSGVAELLY